MSIQIARLSNNTDGEAEIEEIEGAEYYICPPISSHHRLGEIVKNTSDSSYRVLLTPHCHLAIQAGSTKPRTENVLTVKTISFAEGVKNVRGEKKAWNNDEAEQLKQLRKRIQIPANSFGQPSGRYCFLPGFLDMGDLFADLEQVESVPLTEINSGYERFAVLDNPYAESFQAALISYYSNIGVTNLRTESFKGLIDNDKAHQ